MNITEFYKKTGEHFSFSKDKASEFAKTIADDFNPLHDPDSRRFCVPGDLLFSLLLTEHGLYQKMHFNFSGMVSDSQSLHIDAQDNTLVLKDDDKNYLEVEHNGDHCQQSELIKNLTQQYVAFSGKTFPHILVPLMSEQAVMINPARPMVMYQSMAIELEHFDFTDIELKLDKSTLDIDGKRGKAKLEFILLSQDKAVGKGEKHLLLSGLQAYDQQAIDDLVEYYDQRKSSYLAP